MNEFREVSGVKGECHVMATAVIRTDSEGIRGLRCSAIVGVQPAEDWEGDDLPRPSFIFSFARSSGYPLLDTLMRAGTVEVVHVFSNHPVQLSVAEDQRLIGRPGDR